MIISHHHKFIFFAVPKTATHAIRLALREHLNADDWEQQTLFGKQYLPVRELAALGHGHISVRELKPHLPADAWESYFKFAFVRNPFDRFVSTCFFLNRGTPHFEDSVLPFMKEALKRPRFKGRVLVKPQADLLTSSSGEVALDFVGRYESLQESFDEICRRIGIPTSDLSRKNASQHGAYDQYYDQTLQEQVADFYRNDFRLFYDEDESTPPIN